MAEFLKHYSMKIHTLSPVHIGNGEAIGKKEYIYLPWKQIVIIPDIARMYSDMRKKGMADKYQQYLLGNDPRDFGVWLKTQGFQAGDYQRWKRYELAAGDAFLSGPTQKKQKNIACFIKDTYGMPYVPGSSIKGMIRTALLAWEIKCNRHLYDKDAETIRQNAGVPDNRKRYLGRETENLEVKAFHKQACPETRLKDAVNSSMAGLIVGDSRVIPLKQLTLCQKVDYMLDGRERVLPILREALVPETDIYFEITIDTKICPYTMEDILQALEEFQKMCYHYFYSRFHRGSQAPGTVWLGGGAGFLSKTVLYPLLGEEAYRTVKKVFSVTLSRKVFDEHKHEKDSALRLSPHVCKCTRYRGQLYDMGMGRIEVIKW